VVVYQGTTNFGLTEIPVPVGREVALTAQIDPNTRAVVVSFAPGPGAGPGAPESAPMSSEATEALREATVQIVQAQQSGITRSDATGQPGGPNSSPPPGQGDGSPGGVRPASQAPRTTPGAGL